MAATEFIAGRTLGRDGYRKLLRDRLEHLADIGIRESFLVRAVADEISHQFSRLADADKTNASRQQMADFVRAQMEDLPGYRTLMANQVSYSHPMG